MKNEADTKVQKAVQAVENEQGSMASAGSEPPKGYGHSSAPSDGVGGNLIPGGKKSK